MVSVEPSRREIGVINSTPSAASTQPQNTAEKKPVDAIRSALSYSRAPSLREI